MKKLFLILSLFAIQGVFAMEEKEPDLIAAVDDGDEAEVRRLIARGANVDEADWQGRTPLMIAAIYDYLEIAKILLDHGANVNAQLGRVGGTSALVFAAARGNDQTVQLLLARGADVNPLSGRITSLIQAAQNGHIRIVRILLRHGANVNAQGPGSIFALRQAVLSGGDIQIVRLLLDNGADINMVDSAGNTALHLAAEYGRERAVRLLLARGANKNLLNVQGLTPLGLAQANGRVGVVRILTEACSVP